jgi:peptidoglycan/LPS O-acetylase OafA/YrhL
LLHRLSRAALRRDAPRLPGSPPPGPDRFPLFDSLRAVAALTIVVSHLTGVANFGVLHRYFRHFNVGVTVFFLISGFLLYRPFVKAHLEGKTRPDLGAYAWRRLLRIVPAYWVALTVISTWLGRDRILAGHGVTYLLFAQIYRPSLFLGGLGQAWSLCVEVTFYAFLPLWALLMARRSPADRAGRIRREWLGIGALVLVSLAYKVLLVNPHPQSPFEAALPRYLDWFGLGMALALASLISEGGELPRALRPLERRPGLAWLFAVVVFLPTGWIDVNGGADSNYIFTDHYLYALAALGVLAPAVFGRQDRGLLRRFLAHRVMVWIGLISYAIFLWHLAVIEQLSRWGTPVYLSRDTGVPASITWIALAVPPTLLISWLSWVVVERPVLKLKRDIPWRQTVHRREILITGCAALALLVVVLPVGRFRVLEGILALGTVAALVVMIPAARRWLAKHGLQSSHGLVLLGVVLTLTAIVRFSIAATDNRVPSGPTFVAATHDGKTLRLYVNGGLVASKRAPGQLSPGRGFFTIGGGVGNGAGWDGTIDDVAIYRRPLSEHDLQIQRRTGDGFGYGYAATLRKFSGLLDYWRLDEPKGKYAYNSGGTVAGIYGDRVKHQVPGLLAKDSDTAAHFDGSGASVIMRRPSRASLARGFTLEAWTTVGLTGNRVVAGLANSYSIRIDSSGRWRAAVVINEHTYSATGGKPLEGYVSRLRPGIALLAVFAALGILVGGLSDEIAAVWRRQPRRRRAQQRPVAAPLVQPVAAQNGQRAKAVRDAGDERDAGSLEEVAGGNGQLDHAGVAGHDLGEDLLVENEAVAVAVERNGAQEVDGEGAVAGVVLGEAPPEAAVLEPGEEAVADPLPARHPPGDGLVLE